MRERRRFFLLVAWWCVVGVPWVAQAAGDVTVGVYTRHTLRGVSKEIPPAPGMVPGTGLQWTVPQLAYGMDATVDGVDIARREYAKGLKAAMGAAMKALGERGGFDGRWDGIRADLGTQRTYWTGLMIQEGLGGGMPVTGCRTRDGEIADPVTNEGWVGKALGEEAMTAARARMPAREVERVRVAAEDFLMKVQEVAWGRAERVKLPPVLEDGTAKRPLYGEIGLLGVSLEMAAPLGPPLGLVLGVEPKGKDQGEVVARGLTLVAARWLVDFPGATLDLAAWSALGYIAQLPEGRREILVGHDEQLFCMRKSLGLVDFDGEPESARVYPMETLICARNAERAAIVGMRMVYERDGTTRGKFAHRVLWTGTRAEWEARVAAVRQRVAASPLTARWVNQEAPPTAVVSGAE